MNVKYQVAAVCVLLVAIGASVMSQNDNDNRDNDVDRPDSVASVTAQRLLTSLPEGQRNQAQFDFDTNERTKWNYVPMPRAGLALKDMSAEQRTLVDPLLHSALSPSGFDTATQIIAHENVLGALEGRPSFRDPGLYYTAVFGNPSLRAPWAWRFEGHHLSVNATWVDGKQTVAPLFMGSNPAQVPSGPKAGLRILAVEEDLARALMAMLPEVKRARAMLSEQAFADIVTRNDPKVHSLALEGLAASDMNEDEQAQLRKLLHVYADRMTESAARDQLDRIERAGFGKLHFGWAGSIERGKPHYYRIHGPTVLIEYDNTQNNANHIHTVWRDLDRDFGGDLLRAHYAQHRPGDAHGHEH
jgi:Protein of unknown function (DUF3500)